MKLKKTILSALVLAPLAIASNSYASTQGAAAQLLQGASGQQVLMMSHSQAKRYGKNHMYAQLKTLAKQEIAASNGSAPVQPSQCYDLTGKQMMEGAALTTKATVEEIFGHKVPKYGLYWALDGASIGVDAANYAQLCTSSDDNQKELGAEMANIVLAAYKQL